VTADELGAAGITDPRLRQSYLACRRLNASHGRSYFLATRLLPPSSRPAVHALYGFARRVDDVVDDVSSPLSDTAKAALLDALETALLADGETDDPPSDGAPDVVPAVRDTMARYDLDPALFADFLAAMRQDLTCTSYDTYDDLLGYMHGSAGAIGLQMLPVLGTVVPPAVAQPYAYELGIAFQLTNFVRDVGEDLRRGRVYLPAQELAEAGVTRADLESGIVDDAFRHALTFQIQRARRLLSSSRHGIRLLAPESRECVWLAWRLYGGILDAVERADYQVLDRRVAVGLSRRAAAALPALVRARRTRTATAGPRAAPTTPTSTASGSPG
jgi:phytoene synthase